MFQKSLLIAFLAISDQSAILDVWNSLSIAILAISDRYRFIFFDKMATVGQTVPTLLSSYPLNLNNVCDRPEHIYIFFIFFHYFIQTDVVCFDMNGALLWCNTP